MAKPQKTKQSARLKKLVAAAEELNEVLGIEPEIDITLGEEELEAKIVEASELITTEDEFTDATEAVLESLAPSEEDEDMAEGDVESGEDFDDEEEEDDEDDEDDEDADDFEEDDDDPEDVTESLKELVATIKTIKKRADLKAMVETDAVFEPLRSKMKTFSTAQALHNGMLKYLRGLLENAAEEKEPAKPAAQEKKASAPPAKKSKPAATKRTGSTGSKELLTELIQSGKHTRKEIVNLVTEKLDVSTSTVQTHIADGKNPKYCTFPSLIIEDKNGKLKFEK